MTVSSWSPKSCFVSCMAFVVALIGPAAHADRTLLDAEGIEVLVPEGDAWCAQSVELVFSAQDASSFQGDRIALQQLLGGVRAILQLECPGVQSIRIRGEVDGRPVYSAQASADEDWVLASEPVDEVTSPRSQAPPVETRQAGSSEREPGETDPSPPAPSEAPSGAADSEVASEPAETPSPPTETPPAAEQVARRSDELARLEREHERLKAERGARLTAWRMHGNFDKPGLAKSQPIRVSDRWQSSRVSLGPQEHVLGLWRRVGEVPVVREGDRSYRRIAKRSTRGLRPDTGILDTREYFADDFFLGCDRCYFQDPTEPIKFRVYSYWMDDQHQLEGGLLKWSYELVDGTLTLWVGPKDAPTKKWSYQRPTREECEWYKSYKAQLLEVFPGAPDHPAYRKEGNASRREAFRRAIAADATDCSLYEPVAGAVATAEAGVAGASMPAPISPPTPPPVADPRQLERLGICLPIPDPVRNTLWPSDGEPAIGDGDGLVQVYPESGPFRIVRLATRAGRTPAARERGGSAPRPAPEQLESLETGDAIAYLRECRQEILTEMAKIAEDRDTELELRRPRRDGLDSLCSGIQDELWRRRCPVDELLDSGCRQPAEDERGCSVGALDAPG